MIGADLDTFWGFAILASAVLAGLKLSGEIAWSWVLVTAPLWLPLAISVSLRLAALAVLLAVVYLMSGGSVEELRGLMEKIPL